MGLGDIMGEVMSILTIITLIIIIPVLIATGLWLFLQPITFWEKLVWLIVMLVSEILYFDFLGVVLLQ